MRAALQAQKVAEIDDVKDAIQNAMGTLEHNLFNKIEERWRIQSGSCPVASKISMKLWSRAVLSCLAVASLLRAHPIEIQMIQ